MAHPTYDESKMRYATQWRHLTTHSTRPPSACLSCSFIGSIQLVAGVGRRVNSGVRHALSKQENLALCDETQKTYVELNDTINGRSNNTFNASGYSSAVSRKGRRLLAMLPAALIRALDVFLKCE